MKGADEMQAQMNLACEIYLLFEVAVIRRQLYIHDFSVLNSYVCNDGLMSRTKGLSVESIIK